MRRFLKPDATDENWEYYGKKCPYFGVVSWPRFRPENMNNQVREEFFETGNVYLGRLFDQVYENIQPGFKTHHALDFGCGVGRLLIPLAQRCEFVTGVDVSPSMLAEAKKNCSEKGLQNVSFVESLDDLVRQRARFDFIHSYIVFQHIRPARGIPLFAKLIELLEENGIGAIHLTFSSSAGTRDRTLLWLYRKVPLLYGVIQVARGARFSEPLMDMAEYPLNRIFAILQDSGCHTCCVRFTRHGVRGITIIFKKATLSEI